MFHNCSDGNGIYLTFEFTSISLLLVSDGAFKFKGQTALKWT